MKKTMVVVAAMAMILSLGTAFASSEKADGGSKIDNDITYSELGPAAKCAETPVTENHTKNNAFSNGISISETRG